MSSSHLLSSSLAAATTTPPLPSSFLSSPQLFPSSVWFNGAKNKRVNLNNPPSCNAISKPRTEEYKDVFHQNGLPVIKWHDIVDDDLADEDQEDLNVTVQKERNKYIESIKTMFGSMSDGEISVSPYDTAWVALVEDVNGSGEPQFPQSVEWIANNQLPDGSWGDCGIYTAHDRIINTLGCVIALKSWNIHPDKCEKGMAFFRENLFKLEDENAEHMPIGFEVAFPSLLEIAKKLNIEVPDDSPVLQEIYERRNLKLTKIPKDIMHNVPTTLLHSLEGMTGLNWEKLLKLQCKDGSFLFSPSSTAYALMETKDQNSLDYLNRIVKRFNGGVPNVYPVDLFEHIWAVDRLQRLGVSRYFKPEIKECVDYIAKYWSQDGICWARNSEVHDIDDTAMGFRVLRLHGHDVSPDVFKYFEKDGGFVCFIGQSSQAVTGMFNLFRASQVVFPGEKILEHAREFSSVFLKEKRALNELFDKWIITKDLPGEVGYALDVPWYASLPRVETRFYIEQYGGEDDVWIGKTLYRMPYVNNNEYLNLAKVDYNNCQALHRTEWDSFKKWYDENNLGNFGVSRRALLKEYFLATASVFEPERSQVRLAWAKTKVLLGAIETFFDNDNNSIDERDAFVHEFCNGISANGHVNGRRSSKKKTRQQLVKLVLGTINQLSLDPLVCHGRDISHSLRHAWEKWLKGWAKEGERQREEAELIVQIIKLTGGHCTSEEFNLTHHSLFEELSTLSKTLCHHLSLYSKLKVNNDNGRYGTNYTDKITTQEIETSMQELVKLVYQKSPNGALDDDGDGAIFEVKKTYLDVVKTYYYTAVCDPATINQHIAKVLFERVF